RVRAYRDVLAACPATVGGQGPCSKAADLSLYNRRICTVRLTLKAMQSLNLSVASPLQANLAEGAMP
ncbi:hypothetical protein AN652_15585, partial [Xanthomonas arboricola pv. pruni]